MARIQSTQADIQGPVNRDENLIDHALFVTLVVGAIIGAIALFLWMFQAGAWSERRWPSVSSSVPAIHWTPVQSSPAAPVQAPVVPASAPQVSVQIPPRIQVDANIRSVPEAASQPPRELSPEERAERYKEQLRREYGAR